MMSLSPCYCERRYDFGLRGPLSVGSAHYFVLAGGLTADNLETGMRTVHPYAVDVSGGVEASKGIKDHGKITEFVNEVYRVDQQSF